MPLPKRLRAVISLIPSGSKVVDIGTDHGWLPVYLARENLALNIIATDCKAGPLEAARANILRFALEGKIELRKGWGLDPIKPGEVDTVVIAGLGGRNILEIISCCDRFSFQNFIFQPVQHIYRLRKGLAEKGFIFKDELLVKEDNRYYQIISGSFSRNERKVSFSELELMVGPILLKKRPAILKNYLQELMIKWENILIGLKSARGRESKKRYKFFAMLYKEAREVFDDA